MQFKEKLMNQTNYNNKTNFGPDFGPFAPNLGLQKFLLLVLLQLDN